MECNLLRGAFLWSQSFPQSSVNPLQLKGQVGLILASVTLFLSTLAFAYKSLLAGSWEAAANYDSALEHRKPRLTCLLLSVSPNVTKEQM